MFFITLVPKPFNSLTVNICLSYTNIRKPPVAWTEDINNQIRIFDCSWLIRYHRGVVSITLREVREPLLIGCLGHRRVANWLIITPWISPSVLRIVWSCCKLLTMSSIKNSILRHAQRRTKSLQKKEPVNMVEVGRCIVVAV